MSYLTDLVTKRIEELGDGAPDFFGVPAGMIAQWKAGTKAVPISAVEKVFDPSATPGAAKLEELLWEGRKVCIALPWYKSTNPVTAFSVMGLIDRAKTSIMLNYGDAFISHTRNTIADNFLRAGTEWMLTIDDDMVVPWGNATWYNSFTGFNLPDKFAGLNSLNRLLSHGKTLVGALYFGRWRKGKPVYGEGAGDVREEAYARKGPYDLIKPTRWVGTGCMLIHRTVFTDIEKKYPHLARGQDGKGGHWFSPSEHDLKFATTQALEILNDVAVSSEARAAKAAELIETATRASQRNSSLGTGEDVVFCHRAAQAGHVAHVDMGLVCGHIGNQIFGAKAL